VIYPVTTTQKLSISAVLAAETAARGRVSGLFGLLLIDRGLRLNTP